MPEEGIQLSPNKQLLTTAEIFYLSSLFVNQGVNKIRLTGGEPTVRKDIVPLMQQIGSLRRNGLKELALTTNAISLHRKLDQMVEAGLTGVNISLDTLDPFQFQLLTRRQGFDAVMKSIGRVQDMNKLGAGVKLKINCVVMRGLNDHQILPFIEKTREEDIEVRFIEYMPFGGNKWSQNKMLPYAEMLDIIRTKYPTLARMRGAKNDTSKTWHIPGFKGRIGFITSMTHNFCGTCNRLRITSDGNLKVCLHGNTEVSLRDILRTERNGEPMDEQAFEAIRQIELDRRKQGGLRFDGEEGWLSKERQLLEVIGVAVKRKQAKHAGMGELENMQNRPMILIGKRRSPIVELSSPLPSTQSTRLSSSPVWSHVPTHLLAVQSSQLGLRHGRLYSTDSRDGVGDSKSTQNQQTPGLAPAFGFQSLRGLFQQPRRGRYSSPRSAEERAATVSAPGKIEAESHDRELNDGFFASAQEVPSSGSLEPHVSQGRGRAEITTSTSSSERTPEALGSREASDAALRAPVTSTSRPILMRDRRLVRTYDTTMPASPEVQTAALKSQHSAWRQQRKLGRAPRAAGKRVPNPFAASIDTEPKHMKLGQPTKPEKGPWGVSDQDVEAIHSVANRATSSISLQSQAEEHGTVGGASASTATAISTPDPRLTHVTSSGEAHMVNVGAKAATKRVAIAFGRVQFSNPEPFRLISENNNKKGDVLGVSRIAGIMAAKRTADLIPLCHPLAISKVEMAVTLEAPGVQGHIWRENKFGIVTVQAQVECTGPTGVEMEALTAVSGAALTVYDMCKAVDREMSIADVQVVYKSGGKSGMHYTPVWCAHVGKQFFVECGLEIPRVASFRTGKTEGSETKDR